MGGLDMDYGYGHGIFEYGVFLGFGYGFPPLIFFMFVLLDLGCWYLDYDDGAFDGLERMMKCNV